MYYLDTFRVDFLKTIAIFEIRNLKFVYFENFAKKQKCSSLGSKMTVWNIFGLKLQNVLVFFQWNLKRILGYLKSVPTSSKVGRKTKMPKLWTKHTLFGIFEKKRLFWVFYS